MANSHKNVAQADAHVPSAHASSHSTGGTDAMTPQFATIELGAASDTTLSRASAGVAAVEGKNIYVVGGADVAVADGGTGQSTANAGFNALSPMTTAGDLILGGASGAAARLAIGTNAYVLTSNGTTAAWAAAAGGSGNVATDTIWDAAGDLAVGSGADTAAKLAKGAAGGYLSMINSVVTWNSGTSVPGTAVAGDRYWRTDLGLEIYYDGTRWLTTDLFTETVGLLTISAIDVGTRYFAAVKSLDVWLVAWNLAIGMFSTNDGSNYWTIRLDKRATNDTPTSIATFTTAAVTAATWTPVTTALGIAVVSATYPSFLLSASVKTGAPSNALVIGGFTYRMIVT